MTRGLVIRVFSLAFIAVSLAGCVAGRYVDVGNQVTLLRANFDGKRVELVTQDNTMCVQTVRQSVDGIYLISEFGADYMIVEDQLNSRIIVPISELCFVL